MAKVFLGVGHGGVDSGAVGYIREEDVNLHMALACRDYLVDHGVKVKMSRTRDENDDLKEEIRECNAFDPDLALDIHNNSGGGDGFEAYYSVDGGKGKTLAKNIEAEVKKIGQNTRGCKTRKNSSGNDYYGFIRQTYAPAVIVEGVFVDNKKDASQADTLAEQKAFGVAYAKGILKTLGISTSSKPDKPVSKPDKPTSKPKKINVKYRAYAGGKWYSEITNYNNENTKGFAGVKGYALRALQANTVGKAEEVGKLKYRLGKLGGGWYDWITDRETGTHGDNYAGDKKNKFDRVQFHLTGVKGYVVEYRAYAGGKWWSWIRDYNNENTNGYAGVKGKPIECIQVRIVKK